MSFTGPLNQWNNLSSSLSIDGPVSNLRGVSVALSGSHVPPRAAVRAFDQICKEDEADTNANRTTVTTKFREYVLKCRVWDS
jgi:hypothetical protein